MSSKLYRKCLRAAQNSYPSNIYLRRVLISSVQSEFRSKLAGPEKDLPGLEQYASELLATLNQLNFTPFISESVVAEQNSQHLARTEEPQPQGQRQEETGRASSLRGDQRQRQSAGFEAEQPHSSPAEHATAVTFAGSDGEAHESIHAWLEAENVDPWIRTAARHDSQLERELAALHQRLHGASPLADIIDYVSTETVRQQFEAYRRINPQGARALLRSAGKGGAAPAGDARRSAGYQHNEFELPDDAPPAVTVAAHAAARAAARVAAEAMARRPAPEIDPDSLGTPGPAVDPQASYSAYLRMRRANLPDHSLEAVAAAASTTESAGQDGGASSHVSRAAARPSPPADLSSLSRVKTHYVRHFLPGNGSPTSAATPSPHVPHDMAHDRTQEVARVTDALEVFHRRRLQDLQERLGNPGWFPVSGDTTRSGSSAESARDGLNEDLPTELADPLAALKRAQMRAVHDKIGYAPDSGAGDHQQQRKRRGKGNLQAVGAEPMSPEDFQRLRRKHVPSAKQSSSMAGAEKAKKTEPRSFDQDAARAAWIKRFRVTRGPENAGTPSPESAGGSINSSTAGDVQGPGSLDVEERYRRMKLEAVREKLGDKLVPPEEEPVRDLLADMQLSKEELAFRYRQRLRDPVVDASKASASSQQMAQLERSQSPRPTVKAAAAAAAAADRSPTIAASGDNDSLKHDHIPVYAPPPTSRTDFSSITKTKIFRQRPQSKAMPNHPHRGRAQLPSQYTDLPKTKTQSEKRKPVTTSQKTAAGWPKSFLQNKK